MKKIILFSLLICSFSAILIFILNSCKKSSDSTIDYATYVAGTYQGFVQPGQLNSTVILSRQSNSKVNIEFYTAGSDTSHYINASVSDGGSGKLIISLTTANTKINGNLNVTTLDCMFNQLHFVGTLR